jgi:hypothetical protein
MTGRTITIEGLRALRWVSDPLLSPEGARAKRRRWTVRWFTAHLRHPAPQACPGGGP